jgi:predicted nucleic acid-binding protein
MQFLDTNILVYAYDTASGTKHEQAYDLVADLAKRKEIAISVQTMQEFFVIATRKIPAPLSASQAAARLQVFSRWRVYSPLAQDVIEAAQLSGRDQLSLWDSMILLAAQRTGCSTLWTEDLSDGQEFGGVTVRNPFAARLPGDP